MRINYPAAVGRGERVRSLLRNLIERQLFLGNDCRWFGNGRMGVAWAGRLGG